MTLEAALTLFVAVPLLTAGLLVAVASRTRLVLTVLFTVLVAQLAAAIATVPWVADGSVVVHQVALWAPGVAIPFVLDMFSALMLTVTSLLTLACAAFAVPAGEAFKKFFPPLVLLVTAGVNGALLTGDLFNFFVFVEVMLLPSYGLMMITRSGRANLAGVAASRLYISVNLLASTLLLIGVALIYGIAGTVNIAELHGAASEDTGVAVATALVLFALGIKAAVVPVHGWLARAYPKMSPAVTAMFSGLHTKIAIYAIYRVYAVLFDGDSRFLWVGVVVFSATMVIGVLGAVGEVAPRSILAFHMVSQIGYILLGVALFGPLGLTAGIFYLLHHMIVKAALFLAIGAIEVRYGPRRLGQLSGLAKTEPLIAVAFFAAAMSLAGIPPFSGFVAKLSLIIAAFDAGQIAAAAVAVAVSILTLLSMLKIWTGIFLGEPTATDSRTLPPGLEAANSDASGVPDGRDPTGAGATTTGPATGTSAAPTATAGSTATTTATTTTAAADEAEAEADPRMVPPGRRIGFALAAPALALAVVTLGLGLGGQLLLELAGTAAANLYDPTVYVRAVLG
ncbi:monovalent cation/H+ antiporter subunit D family protein [Dietzia sp. DQ11-71]|nr:monovalent cation/H+ antiporter subunit D family protein [Dietzia sp. DQ11-71]MBB1018590.1 monovalent cation/H+ antiporter subunit D family protein [Dietzia sp. DQ11-71]